MISAGCSGRGKDQRDDLAPTVGVLCGVPLTHRWYFTVKEYFVEIRRRVLNTRQQYTFGVSMLGRTSAPPWLQ